MTATRDELETKLKAILGDGSHLADALRLWDGDTTHVSAWLADWLAQELTPEAETEGAA